MTNPLQNAVARIERARMQFVSRLVRAEIEAQECIEVAIRGGLAESHPMGRWVTDALMAARYAINRCR